MIHTIEADSTDSMSKFYKIYFNDLDQSYCSMWVEEWERLPEGKHKFIGELATCIKVLKHDLRRLGKGI